MNSDEEDFASWNRRPFIGASVLRSDAPSPQLSVHSSDDDDDVTFEEFGGCCDTAGLDRGGRLESADSESTRNAADSDSRHQRAEISH